MWLSDRGHELPDPGADDGPERGLVPAERMNAIKGIGFELHDGSEYDGQYPLMEAGRVDEELINMVQHYKDSPLVQQAILDCKRILSEREQALSEGNRNSCKCRYLISKFLTSSFQCCGCNWCFFQPL